jgi:hypothetical protein
MALYSFEFKEYPDQIDDPKDPTIHKSMPPGVTLLNKRMSCDGGGAWLTNGTVHSRSLYDMLVFLARFHVRHVLLDSTVRQG